MSSKKTHNSSSNPRGNKKESEGNKAKVFLSEDLTTWKYLNLCPLLQKKIRSCNMAFPSLPQEEVIRSLCSIEDKCNLFFKRMPGTGASSGYLISLFQRCWNASSEDPFRALVLVSDEGRKMKVMNKVKVLQDLEQPTEVQTKGRFKRKASGIIIATIEEVLDMVSKMEIKISKLGVVVVDNALSLGEKNMRKAFEEILESFAEFGRLEVIRIAVFGTDEYKETKTLLARLGLPLKFQNLMVSKKNLFWVKHYYYLLKEEEKLSILEEVLESTSPHRVVIFVNSSKKVDWLGEKLRRYFDGKDIKLSHKNQKLTDMKNELYSFHEGKGRVLITTDFYYKLVRFPGVKLRINFDFPASELKYVLRAGVQVQSKEESTVASFVTYDQKMGFKELEKSLGVEIECLPDDPLDLVK